MSKKLYLVRVDMERIYGPLTKEELKDEYAKMRFGIQDEVCSSLNKWVNFDNARSLRKYYPELVDFVEREMLSEWGISQFGEEQDTVKFAAPMLGKTSSKAGVIQLISFVAIGLGLVFGAYLIKGNRWKQLANQLGSPLFSEAQQLYNDAYYAEFEAFMDTNRVAINKQMSTKSGFRRWIPLVRTVAYKRDGFWDGVSNSALRGRNVHGMPSLCSKESWKQRWQGSYKKWGDFLEGTYLPNDEWARILLLDPKYVQDIGKAKGWLEPENYYEACVEMAAQGLLDAEIEESYEWEKEIVLARLLWLQDYWGAKKTGATYLMSGSLWSIACYEGAKDIASIDACEVSITPNESWAEFFEESKSINKAHLILSKNSTDYTEEDLRTILDGIPKKSKFTGLKYTQMRKQILKLIGR